MRMGQLSFSRIIRMLLKYGIDDNIVNIIQNLYNNCKLCYDGGDKIVGNLTQGQPLSPMLFCLGIEDILKYVSKKYDIVILGFIDDSDDGD